MMLPRGQPCEVEWQKGTPQSMHRAAWVFRPRRTLLKSNISSQSSCLSAGSRYIFVSRLYFTKPLVLSSNVSFFFFFITTSATVSSMS